MREDIWAGEQNVAYDLSKDKTFIKFLEVVTKAYEEYKAFLVIVYISNNKFTSEFLLEDLLVDSEHICFETDISNLDINLSTIYKVDCSECDGECIQSFTLETEQALYQFNFVII